MSITNLTTEEINFLTSLNLDPNSSDLKTQIQNLLSSQNSSSKSNSPSQTIDKIYTEIIPELESQGKTWDIDYDTNRSEKKRWESLKKRGCGEIRKVG